MVQGRPVGRPYFTAWKNLLTLSSVLGYEGGCFNPCFEPGQVQGFIIQKEVP